MVDAGFRAVADLVVVALALSVAEAPDGAPRTLRLHVHQEEGVDRVAVEWILKLRTAALEVEEDAFGHCAEDHDEWADAKSDEDENQADSKGFVGAVDVVELGVAGIKGAHCGHHVDEGRLMMLGRLLFRVEKGGRKEDFREFDEGRKDEKS